MKKQMLMVIGCALLAEATAFAAMIPGDGDAWTETSTSGWTSAGVPALSSDAMVGDSSIAATTNGSWQGLTYTFATPADATVYKTLNFWRRITTVDSDYQVVLQFLSQGTDTYLSTNFWGPDYGGGWNHFSYDITTIPVYYQVDQTPFNYQNVTTINFIMSWVDASMESKIDGLNLYAVPEPATLLLGGLGLLLLGRRRRG